jgi:vacuolar-type H+-ATPase subunit H
MTQQTNDKMTKSERTELGQLIRKRERVMKAQATERAAQMLAEFDAQCAQLYSFDDDEVWKQATEAAEKVVAEANATIKARCKKLGVPAEFAPSLVSADARKFLEQMPALEVLMPAINVKQLKQIADKKHRDDDH